MGARRLAIVVDGASARCPVVLDASDDACHVVNIGLVGDEDRNKAVLPEYGLIQDLSDALAEVGVVVVCVDTWLVILLAWVETAQDVQDGGFVC